MEAPWGAEHELSAQLAAALIEEQFPALAPAKAVYHDEGQGSQAFEVAGAWLFRFPKRAAVEQALTVERALLPALAPHLGVPIPTFEWVGRPSARFPFHFVGYRKIAGASALHVDPARVAPADVAERLGSFLTKLHAFPVDEARRLGVPDADASRAPARLAEQARPHLNIARRLAPDKLVQRCRALLDAGADPSPLAPRLVHNHLSQGHILLADGGGAVTGVVDWGDAGIGDPASDFAGLYHWLGEPFVRAVLAHYRGEVDPGLVGRARLLAACLGLAHIGYGVETGRAGWAQAGRRALDHALSGKL
jgi:aminoglycoside phosphotransferase (APT) family kinase protein